MVGWEGTDGEVSAFSCEEQNEQSFNIRRAGPPRAASIGCQCSAMACCHWRTHALCALHHAALQLMCTRVKLGAYFPSDKADGLLGRLLTLTVTVFSSSTTRRPGRAAGCCCCCIGTAAGRGCFGGGGPIGTRGAGAAGAAGTASARAGGGGGGTGSALMLAAPARVTFTLPAPSICTRGPAGRAGGGEAPLAVLPPAGGARARGRVASASSSCAEPPAWPAGRATGSVGASSSSPPGPGVPVCSRLPSPPSTICRPVQRGQKIMGHPFIAAGMAMHSRSTPCTGLSAGIGTVNLEVEEHLQMGLSADPLYCRTHQTLVSCPPYGPHLQMLTLLGARLCRPRCTRCASLLITTGAVSSSCPSSSSCPPRLAALPSRKTTCCRPAWSGAGADGCTPAAARLAGMAAKGGRLGAALAPASLAGICAALVAAAAADAAVGAGRCSSNRGTGGTCRSAGRCAAAALAPAIRLVLICRCA